VILILAFIGNIFFWTAFEQAGSSMNVFAKEQTYRPLWLPQWFRQFCTADDGPLAWWMAVGLGLALFVPLIAVCAQHQFRTRGRIAGAIGCGLLGVVAIALGILQHYGKLKTIGEADEFPASWYQSVNPLGILLFGPVFAALWVWLDRRKLNPSTPMKFAWGLYLLGLAFLAMVVGAFETKGGKLAGPHWLLLTYLIVTWGELCLSPVGLSMITKLAPPRLQSLMMGIWFFSFSLANLLAGFVARFSKKLEDGTWTFVYPGLPGFFLMLVVFPIGAGVVLTLLTPVLRRMMHGVH
jgi:POT family proton-dependent oligopeptide transporter